MKNPPTLLSTLSPYENVSPVVLAAAKRSQDALQLLPQREFVSTAM